MADKQIRSGLEILADSGVPSGRGENNYWALKDLGPALGASIAVSQLYSLGDSYTPNILIAYLLHEYNRNAATSGSKTLPKFPIDGFFSIPDGAAELYLFTYIEKDELSFDAYLRMDDAWKKFDPKTKSYVDADGSEILNKMQFEIARAHFENLRDTWIYKDGTFDQQALARLESHVRLV